MKLVLPLAAAVIVAAAVPQDDMRDIKKSLADLKKSIDGLERRVDAVEKQLGESARRGVIEDTRALLREIQEACEAYRKDRGEYPSEEGDDLIEALSSKRSGGRPYVRSSLPTRKGAFLDRWGNPIRFQNNSKWQPYASVRNKGGVDLWSLGPNGENDSGACDDIGNW